MTAAITPVSPSCASCSSPIVSPHGPNTVYLGCPDIPHIFHRACIARHIRSSGPDADKCPACRTPISAQNRCIIPINNVQLPPELQSPILKNQSAVHQQQLQEDKAWLAERAAARQRDHRATSFPSNRPSTTSSDLGNTPSSSGQSCTALEARLDQIHRQRRSPVTPDVTVIEEARAAIQESLPHFVEQLEIPTPPRPPAQSSSSSTPITLSSITTTFGSAVTTTRRAVVIAAAIAAIACLIFFPMVTSVLTYSLLSVLLPAPFPAITTNVVIVAAQLIFMRAFILPGTVCNVPSWCSRLW